MKVVLSVHFDLSHPVMNILMDSVKLNGLVDNFAGVFASYDAGRKTKTPVYFTNYEEIDYDGAIDVAKKIDRDTFVIVVDTIKQPDINNKRASITNVYNFSASELKKKFASKIHFIDGFFEETEDETFIYGKKSGLKTMYFGVPIPKTYHDVNNEVKLEVIDESSDILQEVIHFLKAQK
jgi:hypothetical protein